MKSLILWLALTAGLSACAEEALDQPATGASASALGTWALGHSELTNDCGSEGMLFPFAPSRVSIDQREGEVVIASPGEAARTYAVDGSLWVRERHGEMDGCALALRETWRVHGISRSHLSATYDASLDLDGECDIPALHSCRVRYAVWGGRR